MAKALYDEETYKRLWEKYHSLTKIAMELNMHESAVSRNLERYGLRAKRRKKDGGITKEDMERALTVCFTVTEIADYFDSYPSHIRDLLCRYGLKAKCQKSYKKRAIPEEVITEEELSELTFAKHERVTPICVIHGKQYRDVTSLLIE